MSGMAEPGGVRCGRNENNGDETAYYRIPEGVKVLQDLIEWTEMNYAQGEIFTAAYCLPSQVARAHSSKIRDLKKIIWFANRELARLGAAFDPAGPERMAALEKIENSAPRDNGDDDINRMEAVISELMFRNPQRNDIDTYLHELCRYGLGEILDEPDINDYTEKGDPP